MLIILVLALPTMVQEDERPNIAVVLIDDMRWDDFDAEGHPFVQTPNIDRLAAEGVQLYECPYHLHLYALLLKQTFLLGCTHATILSSTIPIVVNMI